MENLLYINTNKHPIDVIENYAEEANLNLFRSTDDEATISVLGATCNYQINFNWNNDLEGLHIATIYETKIPKYKLDEIYRLTIKINELLWLGHFDIWTDDLKLLYRYNLLLSGGLEPTREQCSSVLKHIMETSEKYYATFQYVIWGGNNPEEAIKNSLFKTMGES